MKKIGLIAEYNPLHNGHLYHYNKIKELYKDSYIITILSSEFSQRGDLCVFNKFIRSEQALKLGADLVLSNPIYYSMNNASTFAYSNVYFLNLCNVDIIISGSESCDIDILNKIYELEQTSVFQEKVDSYFHSGFSNKSSYLKTLNYYNIYIKSNDLLNYFYFKAIKEINPRIQLILIKRINNNYNDETVNCSNIQSATSIRNLTKINDYVPDFINDDFEKYRFRNPNLLLPIIKYAILQNNNSKENVEGLINRAKKIEVENYKDLVNKLITKRYSESKVKRFLITTLLNINEQTLTYQPFIRVLGFNKNGKSILNDIKKSVKIYTSIKEGINKAFDIEFKADKILDIIYKDDLVKKETLSPKIIL